MRLSSTAEQLDLLLFGDVVVVARFGRELDPAENDVVDRVILQIAKRGRSDPPSPAQLAAFALLCIATSEMPCP